MPKLYSVSLDTPIFLEGPNSGGKSMLGRALHDLYGLEMRHGGGPKRTLEEMSAACKEFWNPGPIIVDRLPMISQTVYDIALGRTPVMPTKSVMVLLRTMQRPIIVVHCAPPTIVLVSSPPPASITRDAVHSKEVHESIIKIARAYDEFLTALSIEGIIRLVRYDRTSTTPEDMAQQLVQPLLNVGLACADWSQ